MIGTWLTNLVFALVGFLFILGVSVPANTLETAALRGLVGGVLFFIVAYFIRWIIPNVLIANGKSKKVKEENPEQPLSDPNTEELTQQDEEVQESEEQEGFQPFSEQDFKETDPIKKTSEYVKDLIRDE